MERSNKILYPSNSQIHSVFVKNIENDIFYENLDDFHFRKLEIRVIEKGKMA